MVEQRPTVQSDGVRRWWVNGSDAGCRFMRSWLRVQVGDKVKQKDGDQHLFPLGFKFAVLGVSGGIDQPLSLLMKMNPLVLVLHLYGVVNSSGVTDHISCMSTGAVARGFLDHPQLENALVGMDFVIIPAGTIGNLGMTRDSVQHQC